MEQTLRQTAAGIVILLVAVAGGGGCFEDVVPDPTGSGTGGAGGMAPTTSSGTSGGGGMGSTCSPCDSAFCDSTLPVCAGDAQIQYNALITCLDDCQGACGAEGDDATNPDDWTDSGDVCADGKMGTVDLSDATNCGLCVAQTCESQLGACE